MPDEPEGSGEERLEVRAAALARVRSLLVGLGCSVEEIDRAVADDVLDLLVVDRLVVPSSRRLTQEDVTELTGLPPETTHRFWRALGFLDVEDDEAAFTDMDIEAARLFQTMVRIGLVDEEGAVQMARVIGSSMARIAEAEAGPGATPMLVSTNDSVLDADSFARLAGESLPAMARMLEYVWRRHLQAATRRAMLIRARREDEGIGPFLAIGFADMVGFTTLSQHLDDAELAVVVARFEVLAHDIVVGLGGRVVKMIGDEVMFTVADVQSAAEMGLGLAEAYADDELLSDVRVALAFGHVLQQEGDYYGPVVNLANRLVGMARPGSVLISDGFRTALKAAGSDSAFTARPLRMRTLRDIGRVQVWKLGRPAGEGAPERGRGFRWERIEGVLRDLEELRVQGQRVLAPKEDAPNDRARASEERGTEERGTEERGSEERGSEERPAQRRGRRTAASGGGRTSERSGRHPD